jgi:hypothetical protein
MNNRIKELAEEADLAYIDVDTSRLKTHFSAYSDIEIEVEKFAESIVKECLYTIQLAVVRNGPTPENQRTHKHLNDIAEKFGITFPL